MSTRAFLNNRTLIVAAVLGVLILYYYNSGPSRPSLPPPLSAPCNCEPCKVCQTCAPCEKCKSPEPCEPCEPCDNTQPPPPKPLPFVATACNEHPDRTYEEREEGYVVNSDPLSPDHTHQLCPINSPKGDVSAGPSTCIDHHPVFAEFLPFQWRGVFDKNFVRDFVGTKTDYEFDCENFRYRPKHLERQIPCQEHDSIARRDYIGEYFGPFPIMSEEYFEWVSVLLTVSYAVKERPGQGYTAIELGARYGTWVVRAAQAYKAFARAHGLSGEDFQILGVEGDVTGFEWMSQHFLNNDMAPPRARALQNFVSDTDGVKTPIKWEKVSATVETVSLVTLLKDYTYVDFLDSDIQKHELAACKAPGAMEALNEKVGFIHFGIHGTSILKELTKLFESHNWEVVMSYDGTYNSRMWEEDQFTTTDFGKVHLNDGLLAVRNKRFS